MNRRGCRRAYTWNGFVEMLKYYPLAKPKQHLVLKIKKKFNKRSTNKFDSNFKINPLQAIMKQHDSLKGILYGEI